MGPAAGRRRARVYRDVIFFFALLTVFGYGLFAMAQMMPQASRGLIIFAERQKDLFVDAGLIHESYGVRAPSSLAEKLREETVIVAARTSPVSAYEGAGVILQISHGRVQILTARHIVKHSGQKIVIFPDHSISAVSKIVISKTHDLALVYASLPYMQTYRKALLSARPLHNGEAFVVMGHPGAKSWTASPGVAESHLYATLLFCPTCERGDSGAGAFDRQGRLHGIIVAKEVISAPAVQTWKYMRVTAFTVEPPDAIRTFLRQAQ